MKSDIIQSIDRDKPISNTSVLFGRNKFNFKKQANFALKKKDFYELLVHKSQKNASPIYAWDSIFLKILIFHET